MGHLNRLGEGGFEVGNGGAADVLAAAQYLENGLV